MAQSSGGILQACDSDDNLLLARRDTVKIIKTPEFEGLLDAGLWDLSQAKSTAERRRAGRTQRGLARKPGMSICLADGLLSHCAPRNGQSEKPNA